MPLANHSVRVFHGRSGSSQRRYQWEVEQRTVSVGQIEIPHAAGDVMWLKVCVLQEDCSWKIVWCPLHLSSTVLQSDIVSHAFGIFALSTVDIPPSDDRDRMIYDLVSISRALTGAARDADADAQAIFRRLESLFEARGTHTAVNVVECPVVVMRIRQLRGDPSTSSRSLLTWSQNEPDFSSTRRRSSRRDRTSRRSSRSDRTSRRSSRREPECAICLEKCRRGMEVRRMQCMHVYHSACISRWLQNNQTCPLCRTRLA